MSTNHLNSLGVYGYDEVEPVILAALVTEDPLLLIGRAGTGKTFLLNSLSEALGLEHRHYNASLIAFDDLVGFPWPETEGAGIRYIETPATVWQAESVLVDEINRCKPEHQNRLFSLVHERRVQGIKLAKLRYRWAAMNPPGFDQDGENYTGCEPLDAALADRFSFLVDVADWMSLKPEDQAAIADPRGEGALSRDVSGLKACLAAGKRQFAEKIAQGDPLAAGYACHVATSLNEAGLRISPRRVRQLTRNLIAATCVSRAPRERLFRLALTWSLPQRSGLKRPDEAVIHAAHTSAWDAACSEGEERWLFEFHREPDLCRKIDLLFGACDHPDTGTIAVSQLLASEPVERAAVFAFAVYPCLIDHPHPPVGAEGLQDVGALATRMMKVHQRYEFLDTGKKPYRPAPGQFHAGVLPRFKPAHDYIETLSGRRKQRASQLFNYLLSQRWVTGDPAALEAQLEACIKTARKHHGSAAQ